MKATIYTTALIILMTIGTSISIFANPLMLEDESYIDDIPFNTESVVMDMNPNHTILTFEEEEYINDIPFNTAVIVSEIADDSIYFTEEEAFINDIPFNTKRVVETIKMEQAMEVHFALEEEAYINDIPFKTFEIVKSKENSQARPFYLTIIQGIQL